MLSTSTSGIESLTYLGFQAAIPVLGKELFRSLDGRDRGCFTLPGRARLRT